MHIEPRLLVFTKGVRARIAATVAIGLLGVGCGIARLGLLGWLIGQIFVGRPLQELVLADRADRRRDGAARRGRALARA